MQRKDAQPLSEIIEEILQRQGLDIGLDQARVRKAWKETMGEAVDRCTLQISFDKGTLRVALTSAVLRNELFMCRRQIAQKINDHLRRQVIENIIFK